MILGCTITNNDYILLKEKYKKSKDTLVISQTDTTMFEKRDFYQNCSFNIFKSNKPDATVYILKNPINGVYYYVFNDKNQLVAEGKYTKGNGRMNFGEGYFERTYQYKKNGKLNSIDYYKKGKLIKTIVYNQNNKR